MTIMIGNCPINISCCCNIQKENERIKLDDGRISSSMTPHMWSHTTECINGNHLFTILNVENFFGGVPGIH